MSGIAKFLNSFTVLSLVFGLIAFAPNKLGADTKEGKHSQFFHSFLLELDRGYGNEGASTAWDLDGWFGGDYNKLWVKSDGESSGDNLDSAEFLAMYSRHISTFWDIQLGVRYDAWPRSVSYAVIGFDGLAIYFVEVESHLFISHEGIVSARIDLESDFHLTQSLIFQPYLEMNLFAQDVPEQKIGYGLATLALGFELRYIITPKIAPYIGFGYEQKIGRTSSLAEENGEDDYELSGYLGLRFLF